jgi:hypothetical protein
MAASSAMMPRIRGRGQVVNGARPRSGHPQDVTVRAGDDLQVHPVPAVLAGVGRPVRRLRRRRRPVTGAPAEKLRPTISTVGRSCLRPPTPNTRQ